ncbi:flagella basal body P-ring formation protein FlgA [Sphingomonas jejuensis]|uniref:Flagella basal body P-ring formation protein FlgA n=1 Tax=Sphingomonas jejuensis TaxID=904715 RepID=A0ABX0XMZ7_9SPHN|nr:flagella basal body P-ring formation protein FlgA [Sphingomonas jejuensis]NJC34758.1 flagella basal body P-ring formation protein FlgA [Sphingomonas jejuensis]
MIASFLLAAAAAPTFTDTAALDAAAAAFAGAPVGAEGGPLAPIDARLRLTPCSADPTLSWRSARRDAIVIQCPDPAGWRLYVAVRMAAAAPAPAPAPGIAIPAARPDPVIRRGDPVSIVAEQAGFSVSTDGVAIADAAPGARIQVRVEGRRNPVQAVAVAPGRATIPGR